MTTLQTNQMNSCCYDHQIESQVKEASSITQLNTPSYKPNSTLRITVQIEKWKYLLIDLTTTITIGVITLFLNII